MIDTRSHLSLLSLVDGRVFASCSLADFDPGRVSSTFDNLLVCRVAEVCFGFACPAGRSLTLWTGRPRLPCASRMPRLTLRLPSI